MDVPHSSELLKIGRDGDTVERCQKLAVPVIHIVYCKHIMSVLSLSRSVLSRSHN